MAESKKLAYNSPNHLDCDGHSSSGDDEEHDHNDNDHDKE